MFGIRQGEGCWNLIFTGHFNDWEMEDKGRLLLWLYEKKVFMMDSTIH